MPFEQRLVSRFFHSICFAVTYKGLPPVLQQALQGVLQIIRILDQVMGCLDNSPGTAHQHSQVGHTTVPSVETITLPIPSCLNWSCHKKSLCPAFNSTYSYVIQMRAPVFDLH